MGAKTTQAWRLASAQHDRRRDQAHAAAGLTVLRFTHAQVTFEPEHVVDTLRAVTRRLGGIRIPVR
jgi:very-short-patch-repair endonuclease